MSGTTLDGIGILLAPTMRSRVYIQALKQTGLVPSLVLAFPAPEVHWQGQSDVSIDLGRDREPMQLRPGEPAIETAQRFGWNVATLPNADVNSLDCVGAIAACGAHTLIYSGMNKALVSDQVLRTGKRLLHVHGGYLPDYRAATGFYFGLLERGLIGVSAIWLDAGVDTGDLIGRRWYNVSDRHDVDLILDPACRADLLVDLLADWEQTGRFPTEPQSGESESYFVIHPVLKHLALRRAAKSMRQEEVTADV